jgi:hypothetical protein
MARFHSLHVEQILDHPIHLIRRAAHYLLLPALLRSFDRRRLEHQTDGHRHGVEGVSKIVCHDSENFIARPRCLLRLMKESRVLDDNRRPSRDVGSE